MEPIMHKCMRRCEECFTYLIGFSQTTYGMKDYSGLVKRYKAGLFETLKDTMINIWTKTEIL